MGPAWAKAGIQARAFHGCWFGSEGMRFRADVGRRTDVDRDRREELESTIALRTAARLLPW